MEILQYLEYGLARLLYNLRGRDAKLFIKGPAFADFPEPTIEINSPDCGPSNSIMKLEYTQYGEDRFPELDWSLPPTLAGRVKEYLLVSEDPDAPLPTPPTHGLFYAIPPSITRISASDMALDKEKSAGKKLVLKGGFYAWKNILGKHYGGPRPPLGHGPHRYFYELIALEEPVDFTKLSEIPTKKELAVAIVGKVAGWGEWVGVFEKQWK
jgi:phosphatidylethanolamine-binding protein (PEBP) family uncharacterized protein